MCKVETVDYIFKQYLWLKKRSLLEGMDTLQRGKFGLKVNKYKMRVININRNEQV